eukprot:5936392-Amphidinium_carterae.4
MQLLDGAQYHMEGAALNCYHHPEVSPKTPIPALLAQPQHYGLCVKYATITSGHTEMRCGHVSFDP